METENPQKKANTNTRSFLSLVITLFGLIYLLLVLLGQVDKQSRRFQIPEVIIFTVVLLLNSESLQRLSKLQFGKEGISLELNEIKQNQEKIQAIQQEQRQSITELKEIFEHFLDNNKPLIAMLKRASEISITDRFLPENSSSPEVPEEDSDKRQTTVLSSLLQLAITHPHVLDSLMTKLKKDRHLLEEEIPSK
jgi:hypothetical protein